MKLTETRCVGTQRAQHFIEHTVSLASTCPPGGTHTPGKVLCVSGRRMRSTRPSHDSTIATDPTSTPRHRISSGIDILSSSVRLLTGQNSGR